jgi:hypothetical protein
MVNIEDNPLYYATIGGVILGIATSINYMLRGSVTGMSGMLYTTVTLDKSNHRLLSKSKCPSTYQSLEECSLAVAFSLIFFSTEPPATLLLSAQSQILPSTLPNWDLPWQEFLLDLGQNLEMDALVDMDFVDYLD